MFLVASAACGDPRPEPVAPPTPLDPVSADPPLEPDPPPPAPTRPPLALDTHVDTTQRMLDAHDDLSTRLPDGHLDFPRMREGGLSGAFFSIWVDPDEHPGEAAWDRALALIGAVEQLAAAHPDEAVLCADVACVRRAYDESKIALLMGVEGAHALGEPASDDALIARIRELHRRGVRYMTITWSNDNALGHSSGGSARELGLTDLGRRAIRTMNRLGMIVDVSHVSDQTFWDIVEVAQRPLLASHSSCRALSDHPRNMTDDMIRAVARGGGAVCVNYYTQFIDAGYGARRRRAEHEHRVALRAVRDAHRHSWQRWAPVNELVHREEPELTAPGLDVLGAHFARIVELGGEGAACLGSDFDGVGELPAGLEDVSDLGALRDELARRGLAVAPIMGENVLRVLAAQTQRAEP